MHTTQSSDLSGRRLLKKQNEKRKKTTPACKSTSNTGGPSSLWSKSRDDVLTQQKLDFWKRVTRRKSSRNHGSLLTIRPRTLPHVARTSTVHKTNGSNTITTHWQSQQHTWGSSRNCLSQKCTFSRRPVQMRTTCDPQWTVLDPSHPRTSFALCCCLDELLPFRYQLAAHYILNNEILKCSATYLVEVGFQHFRSQIPRYSIIKLSGIRMCIWSTYQHAVAFQRSAC